LTTNETVADLIAQGPEISQRWRRELRTDQEFIIGRQSGIWSAPWDARISREHVALRWDGLALHGTLCQSARNPIFYQGRQVDAFEVAPGQHFVIGNTTFTLSGDSPRVTLDAPKPDREQIFNAAELRRIAYRDAGQRIELLGRLPELIKGAATESELFVRLVNLLLTGVPRADAAALLAIDPAHTSSPARVLHWDRHRLAGGEFQPSQRLIQQSLAKRETVLHTWTGASSRDFTATDSVDWAYCTPVPGDASRGWALYLAGRFGSNTPGSLDSSDTTDIRDDIKFTELAAATLSSLRELNRLGRQQAGLSQFFAPVVMEALGTEDPLRVLAPREADVSVLFCDLRGFSSTSERSGSDLLGLLERVSKALGVMTHQILEQGGVVGDFQGDAAMGFWGWPLAEANGPQKAARAALAIRAQFEEAARQPDHPLADFRAGIGIATGKAVAGKIGTADHVKVTVFGPVVNLASRLESMTKFLNSSILLDPTTAAMLREGMPNQMGRIRRVAKLRPYGLKSAVEISELLPSVSRDSLSDESLVHYETALDAFQAGQWEQTRDRLQGVPNDDPGKRFLLTVIQQHRGVPPADWDGVITLESK
jgi:adenylate cyclase